MYSDLHCHPILKSFGKNKHQASNDPKNEANLFFHKKFSFWNRLLENIGTITAYRQADLYSAAEGNTLLLGFSIYAPERDFFVGFADNPAFEDLVTNFGKEWISEIQKKENSYFESLKQQFAFVEAQDNKTVTIKGKTYRYRVLKSGAQAQEFLSKKEENTILLLYNIEGGHNLFHQVNTKVITKEKIVDGSIDFIKDKAPLYFTIAHHFYNQLSGHCESLPEKMKKLRDQTFGIDLNLRTQGEMLIKKLLDNKTGNRVLIDIKHMSPLARNRYYEILEDNKEEWGNIPIIFSHGGANGMNNSEECKINNPLLHNKNIGLFDEEIIRLIKSDGLFGLNLDERVMSNDMALKKTKRYKSPKKRYKATSKLVWNNIEQIVKVCATENLNPWNNICIGSDYDGIINPINGFWTLSMMPRLYKHLHLHLKSFLKNNEHLAYGYSSQKIMDKIFSENMSDFIIKYYNKTEEHIV